MNNTRVNKVRLIEPGNCRYKPSFKNLYTYDAYIRTPSTGLLTIATIVKELVDDTLMYSESISKVNWQDVFSADIVFISIFTFNANRGYEIAQKIKSQSNAVVVLGGLHATLNYTEAVKHCDYVLLSEGDESVLDFVTAIENEDPLDFEGLAYEKQSQIVFTGYRKPPENIDTIPNRYLLHNYKKMVGYNTLWLQVHASRGCPHSCSYCAAVKHFGTKVRVRDPKVVVEDIRRCIDFHDHGVFPRINNVLWITDDNFFANRKWAIEVLAKIIQSNTKYNFTIQARYEVGFDDEILSLLKKAGFFEIAMGIEFLDDDSFETYNKNCKYKNIVASIENIQKHGLCVRGLFIVGAANHTFGVGDKIADFAIKYNLNGVLIQSMYFIQAGLNFFIPSGSTKAG